MFHCHKIRKILGWCNHSFFKESFFPLFKKQKLFFKKKNFFLSMYRAFWATTTAYTHTLWLFLILFKLRPLPVFLTVYLFLRMNHLAPSLWFSLFHSLWTELVWQILILPENIWLSFIILFIFIAKSPPGEEKNEDNLVNNEHRDDILFSCNEE